MSKAKINPGIASAILLACTFTGLSSFVTVAVLLLLFCDLDERVKKIAVKVLTFLVAVALINLGWNLISGAWDLVKEAITSAIQFINSFIDELDAIDMYGVNKYFFTPVGIIFKFAGEVLSYVLMAAKLLFVIGVIAGNDKPNALTNFVGKYANKVINFINNIEVGNAQQAPVQPQAPVMQNPVQQ